MAYNTNKLLRDVDGHPIPQYYNPTTDKFEAIQGSSGGNLTQLSGSKVVGPTLIDTIPFSSFTASASLFKTYTTKLNRNAKSRTYYIRNLLDQGLTSFKIYIQDSAVYVGGNVSGDAFNATGTLPGTNSTACYGSGANPVLSQNGDSFGVSLGMGAIAPTTGNVLIYVEEVM